MLSLEYVAGIMDGEGTIGFHFNKRKDTLTICVGVAMTDPIVPEALHEQFGGHLVVSEKRTQRNARATTNWRAKGHIAYNFLIQIQPLLLVKPKQATVVMAYHTLIHNSNTKVDREVKLTFKNMIHSLNSRGLEEFKPKLTLNG